MNRLGIDENTHLVYEGLSSENTHAVWPSPILLPVSIFAATDKPVPIGATGLTGAGLVFREDSFDPITRVRRGRIYEVGNSEVWKVPIHPMGDGTLPDVASTNIFRRPKSLRVCESHDLRKSLLTLGPREVLLSLGSSVASTLWEIHSWERISTNEDLLSLRSVVAYSSLPVLLDMDATPEVRALIESAYRNLQDSLFVSTPESIIDCARDLIESAMLLVIRRKDAGFAKAEIGRLIKRFEELYEKEYLNVRNHARVVQAYHSRRKTDEKLNRAIRVPNQNDAELCVLCTGAVLLDLGLGR